jgi:hypothetical protein
VGRIFISALFKKLLARVEAGNYLHHSQDRAPLPEDFWLSRPRTIAQRFSGVLGMLSSLEVKVLYPT